MKKNQTKTHLALYPRLPSGRRIKINLSDADIAKWRDVRGPGWVGRVADSKTGKSYMLASAPCGAGCHCDAVVVKEVK